MVRGRDRRFGAIGKVVASISTRHRGLASPRSRPASRRADGRGWFIHRCVTAARRLWEEATLSSNVLPPPFCAHRRAGAGGRVTVVVLYAARSSDNFDLVDLGAVRVAASWCRRPRCWGSTRCRPRPVGKSRASQSRANRLTGSTARPIRRAGDQVAGLDGLCVLPAWPAGGRPFRPMSTSRPRWRWPHRPDRTTVGSGGSGVGRNHRIEVEADAVRLTMQIENVPAWKIRKRAN